jgi:hypothetical protein
MSAAGHEAAFLVDYENLGHAQGWGKDSGRQIRSFNETKACDCPGPYLLCRDPV